MIRIFLISVRLGIKFLQRLRFLIVHASPKADPLDVKLKLEGLVDPDAMRGTDRTMTGNKKPAILVALALGALILLPVVLWMLGQLGSGADSSKEISHTQPSLGGAPSADFELDQLADKVRGLLENELAGALREGELSLGLMAELKRDAGRAEDDLRRGAHDRARERFQSVLARAEAQLAAIAAAEEARELKASTFAALKRLSSLQSAYENTYQEAVTAYDEATAALEGGDFVQSIEGFERATAILSDLDARVRGQVTGFLEAADAAVERYQLEKARKAYEAVLEIEASNAAAKHGLEMVSALEGIAGEIQAVRALEADGELEAALAALAELAAEHPNNSFIEDQRESLQQQITERDFRLLVQRSEQAEAVGDLAAAIAELDAALELMSDPVQAARLAKLEEQYQAQQLEQLLSEGFAALKAGRYETARDHYKEAVELDPQSEEARTGLEKASSLYLAEVRYSQMLKGVEQRMGEGRFPLAARLFNEAMSSRPPNIIPAQEKQEARIRQELQVQAEEVSVTVRSDGRTFVSIIGVLAPDRFRSQDLRLFPDVYKVRGTRKGYQSVERELRVDATRENQSIRIVCSEKL
jgi:tetratricopeptide (TPR) repeat protein